MSLPAAVVSSPDWWTIIASIAAVVTMVWAIAFGSNTIIELMRNINARIRFARGTTSRVIYRGKSRMTAVAYGDHGEVLAFGGFGHSLFFHSFGNRKIPSEVTLHTGYIRYLLFSVRSPQIYSAGDDGCVFKIDLTTFTFAKICQHPVPIYCLALSPEEDAIICGTKDGRVLLWRVDLVAQQPLGTTSHASSIPPIEDYAYAGGGVFSVAFANDGKSIRMAGASGKIVEIDRASRQQRLIADLPGTVFSFVDTAGGALFAASSNGIIYHCDSATGLIHNEMRGHTDGVRWIVLDETENRLVSSSKDKTVRVWDLGKGGHRILTGHTDYVYQLALAPSHQMVASASGDGSIRLWRI